MPGLTAKRADVDSFRAVFVLAADPLHLRSSGLSVNNGRFKWKWLNRLDVNRNDAKLVNSLERSDLSLGHTERNNVHTTLQSGRTGMDTRESQVLEQHACACPLVKVINPRDMSSSLRVNVKYVPKDVSYSPSSSVFGVLDNNGPDLVGDVSWISGGIELPSLLKSGVDLLDDLHEELHRGIFSNLEERRVCGLSNAGGDAPISRHGEEGAHPLLPWNVVDQVLLGFLRDLTESDHELVVLVFR